MTKITQNWIEWIKYKDFTYLGPEEQRIITEKLILCRNKFLQLAQIKRDEAILDIGTGSGILAFGAYEVTDNSNYIVAGDINNDFLSLNRSFAAQNKLNTQKLVFKNLDATRLNLPDKSIDLIIMRSVLVQVKDKLKAFSELYRVLKPHGRLCFFEKLISENTRYSQLVNIKEIKGYKKILEAEEFVMNYPDNPLTDFNSDKLALLMKEAGFKNIYSEPFQETNTYFIKDKMIEQWLTTPPASNSLSIEQIYLKKLSQKDYDNFKSFLIEQTLNKEVTITTKSIYVKAFK